VFLGRFPVEPDDPDLASFYGSLLGALSDPTFHDGVWQLCETTGWENNDTAEQILSWGWTGRSRWLVVVNLGAARKRIGHLAALQGNLDPNVLFASPEQIRAEVVATLDSFGPAEAADGIAAGHIFNLGHGISQHTPPESVTALVDAVHEHSPRLHARA
jgi:uroporphyrinogen-III decarboxylase